MKPKLQQALTLGLGLLTAGLLMRNGITAEIPLTTLEGTIVMAENGKPLPNAEIEVVPIVNEGEERLRTRFLKTDENGRFVARNMVAGPVTIEVSTRAHRVKPILMTLNEGPSNKIDLKANPIPEYLEVSGGSHVYSPGEKPRFDINGFFPDEEVKVNIYKFGISHVVQQGGLYEAFSYYRNSKSQPVKDLKPYRSETLKLTSRDAEGVVMQRLEPENLPEGMYWIDVSRKKETRGTWLIVSKIGLVGKASRTKTLAFVTDIQTGKPIENANIGIPVNGTFKQLAKTDKDGIAYLPTQSENAPLIAQVGESFGFVGFYRSYGNEPNHRMTVYTDRPIYRPGDTVNFKGFLRKIAGTRLALPDQFSPVRYAIRDGKGVEVQKGQLDMTSFASFAGTFNINKEAEPGIYSIETTAGGVTKWTDFSVAAYRKPTYNITVSPEKDSYFLGDDIVFKIDTQYYFGGPVANAKVTASLYRSPIWSYGEDDEEEGYYDGGGSFVDEAEGVTNDKGILTLRFKTGPNAPKNEWDSSSPTQKDKYQLQVSVADAAGKYYDASGSVLVRQGDLNISVTPDSYIGSVAQDSTYRIKVSDLNENPVGNSDVRVSISRMKWDKNRSESVPVDRKVLTARTDAQGLASISFKPDNVGEFEIEAAVHDSRGRKVTKTENLYVYGDGYTSDNSVRLEVNLDKKRYDIGDTARIKIGTDKPGGTALVTVEADDLYIAQAVPLNDFLNDFTLPIEERFMPNVSVNVSYIKEKRFSSFTRPIKIGNEQRKLNITVKAGKESYQPGETVRYHITTKTASGATIPAEVSLGVVDESIYAIAQDNYDISSELYPERYINVETQYSFADLYLDGGDKAPTNISVRRLFKDTASWQPFIQTDANGEATVEVQLPDNLTSWRATVRAVSTNGETGQATSNVVARKPLMVRLEGPAFINIGDQQTVRAMVTNNTGSQAEIGFELTAQNCDLNGDRSRNLSVRDGETVPVEFTLKPLTAGEVTLTGKVWISEGVSDGVELKIPVQAFGEPYTQALNGKIVDSGTFRFNVPQGAVGGSGKLKLTLSPSLAMDLIGPMENLIDYPYGCVEQTMSRFMPALIVRDTLTKLNMPQPARAAEIPQISADALTRLSKMQHSDGSWGWWEADNADVGMTAYVLEGLYFSQRLGMGIGTIDLDKAIKYAVSQLESKPNPDSKEPQQWASYKANDKAHLEYAVALHRPGYFKGELPPLTVKTPSTLAFRALTLNVLGRDAKPVLAELVKLATRSSGSAYWADNSWYGATSTAIALRALVEITPNDPIVPGIMTYLIRQRAGGFWSSTRDTATILQAMSQYLVRTGETLNPSSASVVINGREVSNVSLGMGGISQNVVEVPLNMLSTGENVVEIKRSNPGVVYYSANLNAVIAADKVNAKQGSSGIKITRSYHKMGTFAFESGAQKITSSPEVIRSAKAGDVIEVRLTIENSGFEQFLMLQDPIPAGCRIVERDDIAPDEWSFWWSALSIYDNRAAFFIRYLEPGTRTIVYRMRAELPGTNKVLPATISNMYDPSIEARTDSETLEIRP